MRRKSYRAKSPLERLITQVIQGVFQRKESPEVQQICDLVIADPRFHYEVMQDPSHAKRVQVVGLDRMVRNVLAGLRFIGGPYEGQRACVMIPTPGRARGFLRFTNRASVGELELARDRRAAGARGLLISRDVLDAMVQDVRGHGADTLEQVHGAMAMGL